MRLGEIFKEVPAADFTAKAADIKVGGMQHDSRRVNKGDLFACLPSAKKPDPRQEARFIREALARGAAAVLAPGARKEIPAGLRVVVPDVRPAYGIACAAFYGWPSRRLKLVGVTGTNGKTTTTFLVSSIFGKAGLPTAVFGTVGYHLGRKVVPAPNTTPSSLDLQSLMARALKAGDKAVAMEVSSHALDQARVAGCEFDAAIFTNLTQDHLDYHKTLKRYRAAKGLLFRSLGTQQKTGLAVINRDDPEWEFFSKAVPRGLRQVRYGLRDGGAEVRAGAIRLGAGGTRFTLHLGGKALKLAFPLAGRFNISNALAAAAAAWALGIAPETIAAALEKPDLPPGRLEKVDAGQPFLVLVDYAHTPDALQRVLETIREFAKKRVITVFGCGGDRDAKKRPIMGAIARRLSDLVLVTSDNPRSEEPMRIIEDIMKGMPPERGQVRRVLTLADREVAIHRALKVAQPGDVVLIAGKGHEDYQIVGDVKLPFDDRLMARQALGQMGWRS